MQSDYKKTLSFRGLPMSIDDIIALRDDLPEHDLFAGKHGFIVEVNGNPPETYLVEFLDSVGRTINQVTIAAEQLKLMWSA